MFLPTILLALDMFKTSSEHQKTRAEDFGTKEKAATSQKKIALHYRASEYPTSFGSTDTRKLFPLALHHEASEYPTSFCSTDTRKLFPLALHHEASECPTSFGSTDTRKLFPLALHYEASECPTSYGSTDTRKLFPLALHYRASEYPTSFGSTDTRKLFPLALHTLPIDGDSHPLTAGRFRLDTRRPEQGRSRATTPNEDRYFTLTARRHRNMNATLHQQHLRSSTGTTISTETVRNRR
ncbi:hypothetical protein NPIL_88031 [Nephila pilipes]|uniref:Uncharacterized protein n=1 Tax=Nephila pilipes TaxID=299642 RepID=A0A8X6NZH0_NEPPI|nr:hypothetical protein NPIL_88031 [Nephila pilipes]